MTQSRPRPEALIVVMLALLAAPRAVRAGEADSAEPMDMTGTTVTIGKTPFTMQGFGNVNFNAAHTAGRDTSGFQNGALDLFITSHLDDHWSGLMEMVFEPDESNSIVGDLERFEFVYEQSDVFRIAAGRVHSPFLRWPITAHHGLFMQTPVDRPIIARWEDEPGYWPVHFVGLLAQGRFAGDAGLNYAAGVGNGRGHILDEVQIGHDANQDKAVVASLGLSPAQIPGLELHASYYGERIPAATGKLRERDDAFSGAYVHGDVELRGEWSRLDHEDEAGTHYLTTGWYALGAYRLPLDGPQIKLYVLAEELDAPGTEAYLGLPTDERAVAAGFRWDATRWVAIKADYRTRKVEGMASDGTVRAQLAVNF